MKKSAAELKAAVNEKYSEIARTSAAQCCQPSCGCSSTGDFSDDYTSVEGYVPEADLTLGCGIPTEVAGIEPGDIVLDLGSGAGNDVFVARRLVGPTGRVIGIDMSEAMIQRAHKNNRKLGFSNVEFRLGEIETLPVESDTIDVVLSNCVLNLVPDKPKAFAEIFRVLKPGGHFSISDVVLKGELPPQLQDAVEMYAGCVSGALQREAYLEVIHDTGFVDVTVCREKSGIIPDATLREYMGAEELSRFRTSGAGILSITVTGRKP